MVIFTTLLTWLGSLLGGPFAKAAVDAYSAKLASENSKDAKTAEIVQRELTVEQRELELKTQLLIAEQGNFITRIVRPLWALPFIVWTWKVVVWDICLGWGSTPELKGIVANLCLTVAGAYFIGRSAEKVTSIIMARKS
jgi:hypothetical protein